MYVYGVRLSAYIVCKDTSTLNVNVRLRYICVSTYTVSKNTYTWNVNVRVRYIYVSTYTVYKNTYTINSQVSMLLLYKCITYLLRIRGGLVSHNKASFHWRIRAERVWGLMWTAVFSLIAHGLFRHLSI